MRLLGAEESSAVNADADLQQEKENNKEKRKENKKASDLPGNCGNQIRFRISANIFFATENLPDHCNLSVRPAGN